MKKTKLLSLILSAALCLSLSAPALAMPYGQEYQGYTTATGQQYRDVDDSHWAKTSIETCSQRSWFNGYPDGTFRPEGLITREEAAKVFAVAMGLEIENDPAVTYTDTKDNWAKAYIEATKPLFPNVANLQGTASFRPKQTITREETIYALVVAWGYGSKTKNADLSVLNMFSDTGSISAGVKPYMAVAVSEGLVSGLPDGTIAAQKGLTRAEFATLLARALSHGYGDTKQEFQAPAITVDKYSATTTEAAVRLTGTVTPADAALTLDGEKVAVGKNGAFTLELELTVGKNAFTLTAENAYGTKTTKDIAVERMEEAVSIRILSDVPETTEAATLAVNGKVENWSDACTLLLDNRRVSVDKDGYFQVTLKLEEGRNAFALTVARGQKEAGAATIQVTRTTPQPEPSTEPTKPSEKPSADPAEGSSSQGKEEVKPSKAPEKEPEPTPTPSPEPTYIPAETITITNGYHYLYIYKPTGERIKQIGGDGYEVHMTPNSTYQLDTVITPRNTTDPVEYSVMYVNGNPANGSGVSVDDTGLITAGETAYGDVIVRVICGNCKTDVYIIMCNAQGERI